MKWIIFWAILAVVSFSFANTFNTILGIICCYFCYVFYKDTFMKKDMESDNKISKTFIGKNNQ